MPRWNNCELMVSFFIFLQGLITYNKLNIFLKLKKNFFLTNNFEILKIYLEWTHLIRDCVDRSWFMFPIWRRLWNIARIIWRLPHTWMRATYHFWAKVHVMQSFSHSFLPSIRVFNDSSYIYRSRMRLHFKVNYVLPVFIIIENMKLSRAKKKECWEWWMKRAVLSWQ
jgi:hypothetical protein